MPRPSAREQIVQAGLKCLVEKSFNGVGVQDITATAGVPKGSFYNHFESKEALGAEIVERYGADTRRRELLSNKSIPPLERLRRHYERLNTIFVDAKFERGCILGNFCQGADRNPAVRAPMSARERDRDRPLLHKLIERHEMPRVIGECEWRHHFAYG